VTNQGETTITNVSIEVVVNGLVVDVIDATVDISFQEQESVAITINDNLQQSNNNISLNLVSVNFQTDEALANNSAGTRTTLDSDYDIVTLIINTDNYPGETSWEVIDEGTNQVIDSGGVLGASQVFSEDICLDYGSCFSLYVYDSYGDGICCGYGAGNFLVLNSSGETIVTNDGDFDSEAQEMFCPDGTGCGISAEINITHSTSASAIDGAITIYTSSG